MAGSLFVDDSLRAAQMALDGLGQRQQVISRNIANVDTPGYRAQSLSFEDAIRKVLNRGSRLPMQSTSAAHLASVPSQRPMFTLADRPAGSLRADENSVDIDQELTEMTEAGIAYQAISQSLSKKLQLLKTIANSR